MNLIISVIARNEGLAMNSQVRELTINKERSSTYPEKNKREDKKGSNINEALRDAWHVILCPQSPSFNLPGRLDIGVCVRDD